MFFGRLLVDFRLNFGVGVLGCWLSGSLLGLFAQLVIGRGSLRQARWRGLPSGQLDNSSNKIPIQNSNTNADLVNNNHHHHHSNADKNNNKNSTDNMYMYMYMYSTDNMYMYMYRRLGG